MGLREVFESVCEFFDRSKMDYAVIGAFALYGFGYERATKDIDFVTRLENREKIRLFLEPLEFATAYSSNAFSNHIHPLGAMRVDFMYVDTITGNEIFSSVQKRIIFKERLVPVVAPQHLIAMKSFSAGNNPGRRLRDLADIREIVKRVGIDESFLRKCLVKYGLERYYGEIVG